MAATFWTPGPDAFATSTGAPGAQPNGTQMQGNPNPEQLQNNCLGAEPNQPQNPVQQLTATQLSNGALPTNLQPTTVLQGTGPAGQGANAGGDSLLAQIARGQVILADSTYGQGGFIPQNGGSSPQAQQPAATNTQPTTARVASSVTYAANAANISGA